MLALMPFGRRAVHTTIAEGRKRTVRNLRRDPKDWPVLLKEHHAGYITSVRMRKGSQGFITDNANGKSYMGRGSIRRGEALLAGLFRCARCGRKLRVHYSGKGGATQRYLCCGRFSETAARFNGLATGTGTERLFRLRLLCFRRLFHACKVYPVHAKTRKTFGLMTRKLSVTNRTTAPSFAGLSRVRR